MQQVGIRELKNRLTHYLDSVKNGERVVVTDRGRPVAVLHSLDRNEARAEPEELLAALAMQGLLRLPVSKGAVRAIEPLPLRNGEPSVAETLIADRR